MVIKVINIMYKITCMKVSSFCKNKNELLCYNKKVEEKGGILCHLEKIFYGVGQLQPTNEKVHIKKEVEALQMWMLCHMERIVFQ